jgi:hypothetical protein
MRELATADRIRRLIEALGDRARGPGRIYLVGGATAVLERAHAQDLLDVEQLFGRRLVTAQQLRDGFDSIRAAPIRYPGIDADSFATRVNEALRQLVAAPEPNETQCGIVNDLFWCLHGIVFELFWSQWRPIHT